MTRSDWYGVVSLLVALVIILIGMTIAYRNRSVAIAGYISDKDHPVQVTQWDVTWVDNVTGDSISTIHSCEYGGRCVFTGRLYATPLSGATTTGPDSFYNNTVYDFRDSTKRIVGGGSIKMKTDIGSDTTIDPALTRPKDYITKNWSWKIDSTKTKGIVCEKTCCASR